MRLAGSTAQACTFLGLADPVSSYCLCVCVCRSNSDIGACSSIALVLSGSDVNMYTREISCDWLCYCMA